MSLTRMLRKLLTRSGSRGVSRVTVGLSSVGPPPALPGHVAADEPYYLLEEQGYEFGFPPTLEDYRALLACSVRSLSPPLLTGVVFDRTPLDYLAYMAATGADPSDEADSATLRPAYLHRSGTASGLVFRL